MQKYLDVFLYNLEHNLCPFCTMPQKFFLEDWKFFFVTCARAPYSQDHLLIIPKRHVILFNDLLWKEIQELVKLVRKWDAILHKKHTDVALLLRDWNVGGLGWKSVDHMHFHLIPDLEIGNKVWWNVNREYLTEKKLLEKVKQVKELASLEK